MITIIITFSYPYMVEKVLFLGYPLQMKILMDLRILRPAELKNHIFNGSTFACVSECQC